MNARRRHQRCGALALLLGCSAAAPEPARVPAVPNDAALPAPALASPSPTPQIASIEVTGSGEGLVLGTFRNTYYDFPRADDYASKRGVPLFDAGCRLIARVPVEFHDAVCVQGSGQLTDGKTVSFARRGCACARRCPRTDQQICFEPLDPTRYPWGRGALGKPIVPLSSVAVDPEVIALESQLFIPEYVGVPRGDAGGSTHDGCFVALDRGVKVRGRHIDIFTGGEATTRRLNQLVPSNAGVTVILNSERCSPQAAR